MEKVIDVSAFQAAELESFLAASKQNRAVLTDFAAIETFKREGVSNIQNAFRIFGLFPTQVLVLKPTGAISRLHPRRKGLRRRLIDENATSKIGGFLSALASAQTPSAQAILEQTRQKQLRAAQFVAQLTKDAEVLRRGIIELSRAFPPGLLDTIRARAPLPADFHQVAAGHIVLLTKASMKQILPGQTYSPEELSYAYPFRYNAAMYCLHLFWAAAGGIESATADKLRNDATDMTYVAHATFFDGLITRDGKLAALYNLTSGFLTKLFRV